MQCIKHEYLIESAAHHRRQRRDGSGAIHRRLLLARVHGGLQRFLLRRAAQLPEPQGRRDGRTGKRCHSDQYKPPEVWNSGRAHQIIHP